MRATRKDVALKAGVSEQTVSYVINNSRKFSQEVIEKVLDVVDELNYKPDMIAKSMVKKQTKSVAILVNDISNPIFGEIFHGFQESAAQAGYSVYLADAKSNFRNQVNDLISRRIDGIYLSLVNAEETDNIINTFTSCGIKVVAGNKMQTEQKYNFVEIDLSGCMKQILEYLSERGHSDIVYLSGLDICNKTDMRYSSFIDNYKKIFLSMPKVIENEFPYETTVESGLAMANKLLSTDKKITAIVTTNDLMAYGAIEAIKLHGLRVPEDISVVGIDDIMYSKYVSPPLTTAGYDKREYGRKIFEVLSNIISGAENRVTESFETYVVERMTVQNLKDKENCAKNE